MTLVEEYRVPGTGVTDLRVYDWGGQGRAVVFAHATGFHGRIWESVIAALATTGLRCISFDARGHGRSAKPTTPPNWTYFADDVIDVMRAMALDQAILVGHSMGGHAVTAAAARHPDLAAALVLFDPVIMPQQYYTGVRPGEHYTARRRREWESADAMYDRFKARPPFNAWDDATLHAYCQHGLLPNPTGSGFVLACEPSFEASIYHNSTAADIYPLLPSIRQPTLLVRSGGLMADDIVELAGSPTAPDAASYFPNARDEQWADLSHFIPMEAPDRVADSIRTIAESL